MADSARHDWRRGAARRRHPYPRRHRNHSNRGTAHHRVGPCTAGRRPDQRHHHHHHHYLRPVCHAARRHLVDRQAVWPTYDLMVPVPGRRRSVQHARQPVHPARAQPHPRHHVPVLAHQPLGHHGARLRLPVDDRRRGALLGHGPRGQGKYLRILAVRKGGTHPQLSGPGRLAARQQLQSPDARDGHRQPVLYDAPRAPAPLRHRAFGRGGHHRLAGAHHRLVLTGIRGHPPQPHAAPAHPLPQRYQGPALYSARQQHHVDRLHLYRAAVPKLRAHGERLRPRHYRDHAHDHDAFDELHRRHHEAQAGRLRLRSALWRH